MSNGQQYYSFIYLNRKLLRKGNWEEALQGDVTLEMLRDDQKMNKRGCQRHWSKVQERHLDQKHPSGKSRLHVGGTGGHRTEAGCGRGLKQEVSARHLGCLERDR